MTTNYVSSIFIKISSH